ncbi:MAG: EamA family transporter [Chloroflexus sp.]|jgi:drug/metabolite transporter (DMT)-like permease|uniref:EamA family transporter n=1 Tax=unclassified Chloroflexus TaxID=2633855 RepID=UPI0004DEF90D|nr:MULTISPECIES: EamA family transporter [unclassified Chloroflexus]MBO9315110.1 EamA family transporter [Chloroflexus sp.]MBO9317671.1 EamA family transporter [Chloroflexus sp.]MBO9337716.1 EamA family transporter [Chloroflexus sp.]MBO9347451.1 EamA family transporter [Chloroflexus sp.]MDN5271016.1 EamA family transporter [Chloroflexus sp. MS-CIW-1]
MKPLSVYSPKLRPMLLVLSLLLTASALTVTGEVLLKIGINHVTTHVGAFTLDPKVLWATFTDWRVILGFALVFGGAIFWLGVISRVDLSFAYPLLALNYVIILIPSRILLNESISLMRLIGALIIVIGVIVITWGSGKS